MLRPNSINTSTVGQLCLDCCPTDSSLRNHLFPLELLFHRITQNLTPLPQAALKFKIWFLLRIQTLHHGAFLENHFIFQPQVIFCLHFLKTALNQEFSPHICCLFEICAAKSDKAKMEGEWAALALKVDWCNRLQATLQCSAYEIAFVRLASE